jgi:hypothetical protein
MAVSCPPKVALEHTQNKAQFGRNVLGGYFDLTASGISHRESGHWLEWLTRNNFGINYAAILARRGLAYEILSQ